MTWRVPSFTTIQLLYHEIIQFMAEVEPRYHQLTDNGYQGVIKAIMGGQFVYRKEHYLATWFKVDGAGLDQLLIHKLPDDIWNGKNLYIAECAVKTGMAEMVRKIKKRNPDWQDVHWYREARQQWKTYRRTSHGV